MPPTVGNPLSMKSQNHGEGVGEGSDAGKRRTLKEWVRLIVSQAVGHVENTPAILAAKSQPKPCKFNRFFILVTYVLYSFLTARVYFAWPNLSNLLFRSDAYLWRCDTYLAEGHPDLRLPENGEKRYACEEQNSAVGNIFVTCLAFAFSFSLAAGLLLDYLGPRLTALIGQFINALAWILLAFASEYSQTYYAAFIFMGIGSDIGYLPLLSCANLYPGHEGLVVAILGAAKSASFAIPTILDVTEAGNPAVSLKDVCVGYAVLGPGLCLLIALVLVPYKHFKPWNEFTEIEHGENYHHPIQRVNDSFASYEAHAWRDSFSSFHEGQWHVHDGPSSPAPASRLRNFLEAPQGNRTRNSKKTLEEQQTGLPLQIDSPQGIPAQSDEKSENQDTIQKVEQTPEVPAIYQVARMTVDRQGANAETLDQLVKCEERIPGFKTQFLSSYSICIVIYSIIKAIMYAFFTTAAENLLGKEVNDFMGAALPFSLIPCIIIGKVVDMAGIMPILFILNGCITLAYGFSMIPCSVIAYLSALLYICYVSFYSSQSYCFVSDTFSSSHFGKIVGTIHLIAGCLSLLKIPMQKMVVEVFNSIYYYPSLIMLALCGINFIVLLVLYCKKEENPHPFWPAAAREVARREAEEKKRVASERRELKKRRKVAAKEEMQKESTLMKKRSIKDSVRAEPQQGPNTIV